MCIRDSYSIDTQGAEKAVELLKEQLKVNTSIETEKTSCCLKDTWAIWNGGFSLKQ